MLEEQSPAVKPQRGIGDYNAVRGALIMRGKTLRSFAQKYDVSIELVRQVISGRCPGRQGTAAKIRRDIIEALGGRAE